MAKKESEKTVVIKKNYGGGGNGMVYGLGLIGALVYYLSQVTTFWEGFIGILKAIVWPVFLIYGLLDFLKL